jgi:NO-binding membrane sensor protein with MHYT domain
MMDRGLPSPPGVLPRLPDVPHRDSAERDHISPQWLAWSFWLFFIAIWVTLGLFQLTSPDTTGEIMNWVSEQSAVVQLGVWIVFLPVIAAVAVWETSLDLWIRLVALAACLTWTTFGLYPRKDGSR